MEAAYGIGVQNRYALFLDEDEGADPFTVLAKPAVAAGGDKKVAVAGKTVGKPQQQAQQGKPLTETKSNLSAGRQNQRSNKAAGGQQQQAKSVSRENQENRSADSNRSPRGNKFYEHSTDDVGARDGKEVRRNFNQRGPRGQFGGGAGGKFDNQRNGKRDFNRHSGSDKTGVKAQEKREGSGSYNWGKATDDAEADHTEGVNGQPTGEEGGDKHADGGKAEADGEGAGAEAEVPKEDEEPPTKTLDEYKREVEEKRMHTQFNIRKAGEGEDKSKWKKTYVLKKKAELSEDEVEYEEIEVEEDPNKRRNRKVLDIDISFRPSDEGRDFGGRRGRGGRGGDRGDRGGDRGGERGDRAPRDRPPREAGRPARGGGGGPRGPGGRGGRYQSAPKFDDPNDFPSLG